MEVFPLLKNDILLQKNNLTLSSLTSLVTSTRNDMFEIREMAAKFMELYPDIPPTKVFIDTGMSVHLMGAYIYWDDENAIVLRLGCFFGMDMDGNYTVANLTQMTPRQIISYAEKCRDNNNWRELIELCPEYFQIEYMSMYWMQMPSDNVYSMFIDVYSNNDYGVGHIDVDTVRKICELKPDEKRQTFPDLPDEVTIYRGAGDGSTPIESAYSWTTDINVAVFFAAKNANTSAKVYTGKIRKENIIEYIDARNECEIFVLPESVYDISLIIDMKSPDEVLNSLTSLSTYQEYRTELARLIERQGFTNESGEHDALHMLRVLLYALIIAEQYPEIAEDYNAIELLCTASITHDIGRTNDCEDESHGAASFKVVDDEYYFDASDELEFLLTYHCRNDEEAELTKYRQDPVVWRIYQILKDADALDRVRFGIRDLDVNMLRCPVSKTLILFATQAVNNIKL